MQFKKKIADEFRQNERPDLKGGVVVIFGNEVAGWMNELRDPQHWEPGCVANLRRSDRCRHRRG